VPVTKEWTESGKGVSWVLCIPARDARNKIIPSLRGTSPGKVGRIGMVSNQSGPSGGLTAWKT